MTAAGAFLDQGYSAVRHIWRTKDAVTLLICCIIFALNRFRFKELCSSDLPQWRDGVERLEHLADHGPSVFAFNFKQVFDPDGAPCALDRERVKAMTAKNLATQQDLLQALVSISP